VDRFPASIILNRICRVGKKILSISASGIVEGSVHKKKKQIIL
jgi:hypothetical protein